MHHISTLYLGILGLKICRKFNFDDFQWKITKFNPQWIFLLLQYLIRYRMFTWAFLSHIKFWQEKEKCFTITKICWVFFCSTGQTYPKKGQVVVVHYTGKELKKLKTLWHQCQEKGWGTFFTCYCLILFNKSIKEIL